MSMGSRSAHSVRHVVWVLMRRLQARYIKCIFELLNATSHSVKYEAATTLTTLTQNPAAVKGLSITSERANRN